MTLRTISDLIRLLREPFDEGDVNRDRLGRFADEHNVEGGLPIREWVDPPPSRSSGGRRAGGHAANGMTNTRFGDLAEMLTGDLGFANALPEGERRGKIDRTFGDVVAVEVKARSSWGTEYKAGMKAHELVEKQAAAGEMGMAMATVVVVVDDVDMTAHVYWHAGSENSRVSQRKGWNHMGVVDLPDYMVGPRAKAGER